MPDPKNAALQQLVKEKQYSDLLHNKVFTPVTHTYKHQTRATLSVKTEKHVVWPQTHTNTTRAD